jgi:hypothetical protein
MDSEALKRVRTSSNSTSGVPRTHTQHRATAYRQLTRVSVFRAMCPWSSNSTLLLLPVFSANVTTVNKLHWKPHSEPHDRAARGLLTQYPSSFSLSLCRLFRAGGRWPEPACHILQ